MAIKITDLPPTTSVNEGDVTVIVQGGVTKKASKKTLSKGQNFVRVTEGFHDYGSVASGTVTPNCDNANIHVINATGGITIETPAATLVAGQSISGAIELIGGDVNAITWGANYDWGGSAPVLSSVALIGFRREFGDTKTKIWVANSVEAVAEVVAGGTSIYSNRTNGYFGGGHNGATSSAIDGIQFSDETAINPAATLSAARYVLAGVSSPDKGYFAGGSDGSTARSEINGIDFTTEAAINPASTISVARNGLAGVSSPDKGYFGGGHDGVAFQSAIDGIQFSDETAINPAAVLSVARYYLAGVSSPDKGYFGGGHDGNNLSTIDGINFTTEAAINPAATLSVARQGLAGVSSPDKGYFGGGYDGAARVSTIDGIDFTTEAAINPASTLSVARQYLAGV